MKDPDVPQPNEENGWTKNHDEVLEPLRTMGDILSTNLTDILEYQNVDESNDDELDLNDDTRWDNDNYEEEIDCHVESDDEFNCWVHYWFKIVPNAFQKNTNFAYDFVSISFM